MLHSLIIVISSSSRQFSIHFSTLHGADQTILSTHPVESSSRELTIQEDISRQSSVFCQQTHSNQLEMHTRSSAFSLSMEIPRYRGGAFPRSYSPDYLTNKCIELSAFLIVLRLFSITFHTELAWGDHIQDARTDSDTDDTAVGPEVGGPSSRPAAEEGRRIGCSLRRLAVEACSGQRRRSVPWTRWILERQRLKCER